MEADESDNGAANAAAAASSATNENKWNSAKNSALHPQGVQPASTSSLRMDADTRLPRARESTPASTSSVNDAASRPEQSDPFLQPNAQLRMQAGANGSLMKEALRNAQSSDPNSLPTSSKCVGPPSVKSGIPVPASLSRLPHPASRPASAMSICATRIATPEPAETENLRQRLQAAENLVAERDRTLADVRESLNAAVQRALLVDVSVEQSQALQKEKNQLESLVSTLQKEAEGLKHELIKSQDQLHAARMEEDIQADAAEELTSQLAMMRQEIDVCERDAKAVLEDRDEIKRRCKEQLTAAESYVVQLQERLGSMETRDESRVKEIAALKEEVGGLEEHLASTLLSLEQSRSEAVTLRSASAEHSATAKRLEQEVKQAAEAMKQSERRPAALERTRETLEFEKMELKSQLWASERATEERAALIASLESRSAALEEEVRLSKFESERIKVERDDEIATLEAKLVSLTAAMECVNQEATDRNAGIVALLAERDTVLVTLQTSLSSLISERDIKTTELENLRVVDSEREAIIAGLKSQLASLTSRLEAGQQQMAQQESEEQHRLFELENALAVLKSEAEKLRALEMTLRQQVVDCEAAHLSQMEDARDILVRKEADLKQMERALCQCKQDLAMIKANLQVSEDLAADNEEALRQEKEKVGALEVQLVDARSQNAEMEQRLHCLVTPESLNETQASLLVATNTVSTLRNLLSDESQRVESLKSAVKAAEDATTREREELNSQLVQEASIHKNNMRELEEQRAALQHELKSAIQDKAAEESTICSLETRLAEVSVERDAMATRMDDVLVEGRSQLQDLQQTCEQLQKSLQEEIRAKVTMSQLCSSLETSSSEAHARYSQAIEELDIMRDRFNVSESEFKGRIAALEDMVRDLTQHLESEVSARNSLEARSSGLQAELSSSLLNQNSLHAKATELEAALKSWSSSHTVADMALELEGKETVIKEFERAIVASTKFLEDRDDVIVELKAALATAQDALRDHHVRAIATDDKITGLLEEIASLKEGIITARDTHSAGMKDLTYNLAKAEDSIISLRSERDALEAEILAAHSEKDSWQDQLKATNEQVSNERTRTLNVMAELDRNREKMLAATLESDKNHDAYLQATTTLADCRDTISTMESEMAFTSANLNSAETTVEHLRLVVSTLEAELAKHVEADAALTVCRAGLSESETELVRKSVALHSCEVALEECRSFLTAAESDVNKKGLALQNSEMKIKEMSETLSMQVQRIGELEFSLEEFAFARQKLDEVMQAAKLVEEGLLARLRESEELASTVCMEKDALQMKLDATVCSSDSSIAVLKETLCTITAEVNDLRTSAENFSTAADEWRQQISNLSDELETSTRKVMEAEEHACLSKAHYDELLEEMQLKSSQALEIMEMEKDSFKKYQIKLVEKEAELEALNTQLQETTCCVQQLTETLEKKNQQAQQLKSENDDIHARLNHLTLIQSQTQQELIDAKKLVEDQADDLVALRQSVAQKDSVIAETQLKLEQCGQVVEAKTAIVAELNSELSDELSKNQELLERADSLSSEIESAKLCEKELRDQLTYLQKEVEALEDIKLDLLQALDTKKAANTKLQTDLDAALNSADELEKNSVALLAVRDEVEKKDKVISEFERALIYAQRLLEDRDDQIVALNDSVKLSETESGTLKQKLSEFQTSLERADAIEESLKAEVEALTQSHIDGLQQVGGELESARAQNQELQARLASMEKEIQERTSKIRELEMSTSGLESELFESKTKLETHVKDLEANLAQANSTVHDQASRIHTLSEDLATACDSSVALNEQHQATLKSLAVLQSQCDSMASSMKRHTDLEQEVEASRKTISTLKETVHQFSAKIEEFEEASENVDAQLSDARQVVASLEVEKSSLGGRVLSLEQDLSAMVKEIESTKSRYASERAFNYEKIASLEKIIEETNGKLASYIEGMVESKKSPENVAAAGIAELEARPESDKHSESLLQKDLDFWKGRLAMVEEELDEKTALALQFEQQAQANMQSIQELQDSRLTLTKENKKLVNMKHRLEKAMEKMKVQLDHAAINSGVTSVESGVEDEGAGVTSVESGVEGESAGVCDNETTPTRSKRQGEFGGQSAGPAKQQRRNESHVSPTKSLAITRVPTLSYEVAPTGSSSATLPSAPNRSRRRTMASRKVGEKPSDASQQNSADCAQQ
ncbi:hypothetical protein BC830DRAFT_614863 [Chytriomyces sp. MP71]|nr:hypothetical protein BC830DRAFT_614863 [Chytriomyces sp. MP71]